MNTETIEIAHRFRGPPESGNGGYVCGAIAELLDGTALAAHMERAVEVTLRSPTPLDTPLLVRREDDTLSIHHGAHLVAEARLTDLALDIPAAPGYEIAWAARQNSHSLLKRSSRRFPDGVGVHPVCFCCGAQHEDGLQVYAAPIDDGAIVAAAWPTKAVWAGADGNLPARFIWTALDCPGQFAFHAAGIRTGMLGRLCARVEHPIAAGERCVVSGWRIGIEGRKFFAGTAVYDERGKLCAYAKAVWIGQRED
jgi:hypothetical protein